MQKQIIQDSRKTFYGQLSGKKNALVEEVQLRNTENAGLLLEQTTIAVCWRCQTLINMF